MHALRTGGEAVEDERTGADLGAGIARETLVATRHDRHRVLGEHVEEGHGLLLELEVDGLVVDDGDTADVEQRDHGLERCFAVGVEATLERVQHVIGGDRLAIAPGGTVLQRDDVVVGVDGLHALGEAMLVGDVPFGVVVHQRLEAEQHAQLVGLGHDVLAVEDVVGAADDADLERAAGLGVAGGDRGVGAGDGGVGTRHSRVGTAGDGGRRRGIGSLLVIAAAGRQRHRGASPCEEQAS